MAPDSPFEAFDPRFSLLTIAHARLETLWGKGRWTEGPVYVPAARHLLFSDIPNDRVLRYDEVADTVATFEEPALNQNGHCLDLDGRVVRCEHRGRAVTRIDHDGRREVLADRIDGNRLNSPNDVVVRSDGSIWFTDPTYGIDSDYEGDASSPDLDSSNVYRIDVGGSLTSVITNMVQPNGLAFSVDESMLYVSDTGQSHIGPENCPPVIRAYPVADDGRSVAADHTTFATCDSGVFDGFRIDATGNLWSSAGDGVHCFAPDGTLLGKIHVPEVVSNVEFGGKKRNRLYICATTSLYAIHLRTTAPRRIDRRPVSPQELLP